MPFRITSDNTDLGKKGDVISDDRLEGLNIDALLAGEHIEAVKNSNNKTTEEK